MAKNHTHSLIDALGEPFFIETLGWTERLLRHAKSAGKISGQWFAPIEKVCLEQGLECPRDAFIWKVPAKDIGAAEENQVPTK